MDGTGNAQIIYLDSDARSIHFVGQSGGSFGAPKKIADAAVAATNENTVVATAGRTSG